MVVIFPSTSVTVRVMVTPSFIKAIVLPSSSMIPPVHPLSESNKLSAMSLDN